MYTLDKTLIIGTSPMGLERIGTSTFLLTREKILLITTSVFNRGRLETRTLTRRNTLRFTPGFHTLDRTYGRLFTSVEPQSTRVSYFVVT